LTVLRNRGPDLRVDEEVLEDADRVVDAEEAVARDVGRGVADLDVADLDVADLDVADLDVAAEEVAKDRDRVTDADRAALVRVAVDELDLLARGAILANRRRRVERDEVHRPGVVGVVELVCERRVRRQVKDALVVFEIPARVVISRRGEPWNSCEVLSVYLEEVALVDLDRAERVDDVARVHDEVRFDREEQVTDAILSHLDSVLVGPVARVAERADADDSAAIGRGAVGKGAERSSELSWPAACMSPARISRMTGRPRRAPT